MHHEVTGEEEGREGGERERDIQTDRARETLRIEYRAGSKEAQNAQCGPMTPSVVSTMVQCICPSNIVWRKQEATTPDKHIS